MSAIEEIEYELTYLAAELPAGLENASSKQMMDVYFPENPSVHPRLRLRKSGETYSLTKKTPLQEGDASTHKEQTIQLDQAEFGALVAGSGRRIAKTRYLLEIDGQPAEVDVFQGDLEGLVLIDFEFNNASKMAEFKVPSCCLVDVTQEDFIAGGLLAGKSLSDIQDDLDRIGYKAPTYKREPSLT